MAARIEPEPGPEEAEAILAALAEVEDEAPDVYRSAWRAAALREAADAAAGADGP